VQVNEMLMLVLAGWCCVQYESIFWWWWWWCWCGFITTEFLCSDGSLCSEAGKVLHCVHIVQHTGLILWRSFGCILPWQSSKYQRLSIMSAFYGLWI